MENKEIVRILVIIGGLLGIFQAILSFGNWGLGFWGLMVAVNIVSSIIGIIISILALLSVYRPGDPIPYDAWLLIIFGVLMTFFNAWGGGIIVLIAGILWLVWKL
jgi:type III secretory pathway component EscS